MTQHIQYKVVDAGVTDLSTTEGPGVVEAIVSVTGLVDNVNDIIEPGAYGPSLKKIKPKGVWSHDWNKPISKTLSAVELLPGDPGLPTELPDGSPWPAEAGAVKIKMQFNLNSTRGRDAYEDVKFFGTEQQWSIGYNVPEGKSEQKSGKRSIKELNFFEYSPVLHGAMPIARTTSVKDAQMAYKSLNGGNVGDWMAKNMGYGDEDEEEFEEKNYMYDEDEDEEGEEKILSPELVRSGIKVLTDILEFMGKKDTATVSSADIAYIESKALMYGTVADALSETYGIKMDAMADLQAAAIEYDEAVDTGDVAVAEKAYSEFLDHMEKAMDTVGEEHNAYPAFQVAVRTAMDRYEGMEKSDTSTREYGPAIKTLAETKSGSARMGKYFAELDTKVLVELKGYYPVDSAVHTSISRAIEESKRQYSAEERRKLAEKGHALSDGSFPIETVQDLKNAIKRCHSGSDPAAAKKLIYKRAKELGRMDLIPEDWEKEGKSDQAPIETKSDGPLVIPADFMAGIQSVLGD